MNKNKNITQLSCKKNLKNITKENIGYQENKKQITF